MSNVWGASVRRQGGAYFAETEAFQVRILYCSRQQPCVMCAEVKLMGAYIRHCVRNQHFLQSE